jgi:hypothetical protein
MHVICSISHFQVKQEAYILGQAKSNSKAGGHCAVLRDRKLAQLHNRQLRTRHS